MSEYFLAIDGQTQGPFAAEQLRQRGVDPESMVWNESMTEWTPARLVPELSPALRNPFLPPPPRPAHGQQTTAAPPVSYASPNVGRPGRNATFFTAVPIGCAVALVALFFFAPWLSFGRESITGSQLAALLNRFSQGEATMIVCLLYGIPVLAGLCAVVGTVTAVRSSRGVRAFTFMAGAIPWVALGVLVLKAGGEAAKFTGDTGAVTELVQELVKILGIGAWLSLALGAFMVIVAIADSAPKASGRR